MDFVLRQKKLREHLATTRLDALLISHLPNIRYLCGFTGSAGFLLLDHGKSVFFTDVRYDTQAHEEVKGARVVIARKAVLPALGEYLGSKGKTSRGWALGVEGEHMTVAERKRLKDVLPSGVRVRIAPPTVERSRMVKDSDEYKELARNVQTTLAKTPTGLNGKQIADILGFQQMNERNRIKELLNDNRLFKKTGQGVSTKFFLR